MPDQASNKTQGDKKPVDSKPKDLKPVASKFAGLKFLNRSQVVQIIVGSVVGFGVFACSAIAVGSGLGDPDMNIHVPVIKFMLGLVAFALMLLGAFIHEVFYWQLPTRKLRKIIQDVGQKQATIDELLKVKGGPRMLIQPIKELVVQLRGKDAEIRATAEQVRKRVEHRAETLEHQLGVLKHQAARDTLTGLLNRRVLDLDLNRLIEDCRNESVDLGLLMIDVDYFKILNDTLGHSKGDELLRSIGQIIRSTIRDNDLAYRYGGDEFVIIVPGATEAALQALSKRLQGLVTAMAQTLPKTLTRHPRLSVGHCLLSTLSSDAGGTDLMHAADQALYRIKHARPKTRVA